MELTEPLFVERIPDVDKAIRTTSSKCVMGIMKGNGVDRVDVLSSLLVPSSFALLLLHPEYG